jgi:xanthine dehydrogenase YagS FAD-binding subunit
MIQYPRSVEGVGAGVIRAGGTDLVERGRHGGLGVVLDIRDIPGLDRIDVEGGLKIGARVTIADVAGDPRVVAGWSGIAKAAGALATPEIRAAATLGGNLAQHTRCWYYRHPLFACLKKGGSACHAREGDHLYHAVFDRSACASVHASTMACALLTYDTTVEVARGGERGLRLLEEVLGDGADPRSHNGLAPGELLTRVDVAAAGPGEKTAYFRAISRARAEWPLVEVSVRQASSGWRIAVGGVASVPMRLPQVEAALDAGEPILQAIARSTAGSRPLPGNAYKVTLLPRALRAALEIAS